MLLVLTKNKDSRAAYLKKMTLYGSDNVFIAEMFVLHLMVQNATQG